MTRPRKEETICTKQFGFEVTVLTKAKLIEHLSNSHKQIQNCLHAGSLTASLCVVPDGQHAFFETPKHVILSGFFYQTEWFYN